jgi:hypothetical protein
MTPSIHSPVQRTIHDYMQKMAGTNLSIETVSDACRLTKQQTGQALADLTRNPDISMIRVSKGIYRYFSADDGKPPANVIVPDPERVPLWPPPPSATDHRHDWGGVKPDVTPEKLEVLGIDKRGLLLVRLPDGTVGRVEPL